MFAWCRDTHQRQDVILCNQCRQNEKMCIDDFNELPLPEPPLVKDPFTSHSATDLVAMEATDDDATSDSEYEDDGEGEEDDDS
jgi:hypothetical protein